MYTTLNLKTLLEIIFKVTKKNANILADCYLLKDKSIISKWKNSSVVPRNDDIDRIVKFVLSESTVAQQRIIRDNIEQILEVAPLKDELKTIILDTEEFSSFLQEALSVSVSADKNSEIQTSNLSKNSVKTDESGENVITGLVENKNGRYKGTLEFDLVIPDANTMKSSNPFQKAGIEFTGKVNLSPKNRIISAAKYLRKTSILGIIFACIVSGSLIAYSTSNPNNNYNDSYSQQNEFTDNSQLQEISVTSTPVPVIVDDAEPTSTPTTVPTPSSTPIEKKTSESKPVNNAQVSGNENKTVNKTSTSISNQSTTNIVNITGNNNILYKGDNNAISIDMN